MPPILGIALKAILLSKILFLAFPFPFKNLYHQRIAAVRQDASPVDGKSGSYQPHPRLQDQISAAKIASLLCLAHCLTA